MEIHIRGTGLEIDEMPVLSLFTSMSTGASSLMNTELTVVDRPDGIGFLGLVVLSRVGDSSIWGQPWEFSHTSGLNPGHYSRQTKSAVKHYWGCKPRIPETE